MKTETFYRVGHLNNKQGLWYTPNGQHTGSINNEYDFCANNKLTMPYDLELVGWLSATATLDELFQWFPLCDIQRLEAFGYAILKYESTNYKEYNGIYRHMVIDQTTSVIVEIIPSNTLTVLT